MSGRNCPVTLKGTSRPQTQISADLSLSLLTMRQLGDADLRRDTDSRRKPEEYEGSGRFVRLSECLIFYDCLP